MCNYFDIETGNISGIIRFMKKIETEHEWSYIIFNNTYYLIDVLMRTCEMKKKYLYFFFQIFILELNKNVIIFSFS